MTRFILLLGALAVLTGCGDNFPDEELHFGLEDKLRPFAVVIEPPEAAPGETVQVTLLLHAPAPDELDIAWRVALDYDIGLYEVDEIERDIRPLAVAAVPTADAEGFTTQTFAWTVPDSALLLTSALPDVIDDPILRELLAAAGLGGGGSPTRAEVDAALKALTPADIAAMPADLRAAVFAVVDRFACQVRLRATLDDGRAVDVTRNLTVRHTGRLGGANANHNTTLTTFAVVAVHGRDATETDLRDPAKPKSRYDFVSGGMAVADTLAVPFHDDWTYFLDLDSELETYGAPYEMGLTVREVRSLRWYYRRSDAPRADHAFFVTDAGDPAEMGDLDDQPRIDPPGAGAVYRIVAVPRDHRDDWVAYHAVPGTGLGVGVVRFVAP